MTVARQSGAILLFGGGPHAAIPTSRDQRPWPLSQIHRLRPL